jgi:hypothetical protein
VALHHKKMAKSSCFPVRRAVAFASYRCTALRCVDVSNNGRLVSERNREDVDDRDLQLELIGGQSARVAFLDYPIVGRSVHFILSRSWQGL